MNLNEIDIKNMAIKPAKISDSANTIKVPERINIPIGQKSASKVDIRAKYNLTQEQYNILCAKYNLTQLDDIQISNIIQKEFSSVVSKPVVLTAKTDIKSVENKTTESETLPKAFNHKEFSELSKDKQLEIYSSELAKNKFIYGGENKKTAQDWDNLSQNEKQELVNNEKQKVDKTSYLSSKMTTLQTANFQETSIDEFNTRSLANQADAVHDYIFTLKDEDSDNLSIKQAEYLKAQKEISDVVIAKYKAEGKEIGESVMSPPEIHQRCKELGINELDLSIEILEQKPKKTKEESERLEDLYKAKDFSEAVKNIPVKNYGRLDAFKNSKYYGADFDTLSLGDKIKRYHEFAKENFASLSPEERSEAVIQFSSELVQENPEIATELYGKYVENASDKEQAAMAKSDTGLATELNASNVNSYNDAKLISAAQKKLAKTDPNRAMVAAHMTLDNVDDKHYAQVNADFADFNNKEVQMHNANVALDKSRISAKTQDGALKNIADKSDMEVKKSTAVRLDDAYGENQVKGTEYFSTHKECNDAMIEDGTFSRFAKENQTKAFKIHKTRCEQNDYSKDEAVRNLNKLSDHIQNCDKDNQLDMHNEIMTSKYSEVQEHAAGNIKNYDPSVQPDAMSSVYKSGNQKAIETAVLSIPEFKSPDVQEVALKQAVMELANLNNDSTVKFANGSLTNQDISKLSPSERREYYLRLFDNASPADKIKYLKQIKDGKVKQTIYKLIGKFYPSLFKSMIQDDVTTAEKMFNMNLGGLNNLVESCIISKAETNPSFKFLRDRLGLSQDENYPQTARTVEYTSIPDGFKNEKFDIYNKDKRGNLMA